MLTGGRRSFVAALAALALGAGSAVAFQADLVPLRRGVEAEDFAGIITIGGDDGAIRVQVEGVNDARGNPLDGRATVHLRLRVNGFRRRVTLQVLLDAGDGEAATSLGLRPDDRVVVQQVRLRGPDRRAFAEAGVVTGGVTSEPPPEPPPAPPPPDQCPDALVACQQDLTECTQELDECELGL